MSPSQQDTTELLLEICGGNDAAAASLLPLVYDELHRIASGHMRRERANHTLQATVLVHDAFIKLIDQTRTDWKNKAHFFAMASKLIRRILVDHARKHTAVKRGDGRQCLSIRESVDIAAPDKNVELLDLDAALNQLATLSERQAQVVELRFFGGLSVEETAQVLDVSSRTVKGDWRVARAWLRNHLEN